VDDTKGTIMWAAETGERRKDGEDNLAVELESLESVQSDGAS